MNPEYKLPDDIRQRLEQPYPDAEYWLDVITAIADAGWFDPNQLLKQIREEGENTTYPKDLS